MNQARNMHTASNRFIKMAPPGWLKYYRDKSHLGRASQPGSCNQGLTVSCNVTQFARDSFVICRFREREIDCLTFPFTKMFRKIRLESKWNTTFLSRFSGKFLGATENGKGSTVFPNGIFQSEIRVPFLQSHL